MSRPELTVVEMLCEQTSRPNRVGFRCTMPAGHEGGHYFVAADVPDGRHDDEVVDQ